jgi:3-hydroxyisobutyrate dehydrogenase-like beta-hydroxyacid dehydrogenase
MSQLIAQRHEVVTRELAAGARLPSLDNVAVIGAGTIGRIVIEKLVQAGRFVAAYDCAEASSAEAARLKATVTRSAALAVADAGTIILCLPGSPEVEATVEQILPRLKPGQVIVNTTSCRPSTDVHCSARVRERGVAWVESPLTRREQGFYLMVGATDEDYLRVTPLLDLICARHQRIGPVGTGQHAKLMQQMLSAMEKAARLEVAAYARRAGIDPSFLKDYLGFSISPRLLDEDPGNGATLQMMYKDLGYYVECAHQNGASIPLGSIVHEIFKTSVRVSDGTWSHDGIHAYYRLQNVQELDEKLSPILTQNEDSDITRK